MNDETHGCPRDFGSGMEIVIKSDPRESTEGVARQIGKVCASLARFVEEKNNRYGNSALSPVNIFSRGDPGQSIPVRIDDKLSRIRNHLAARWAGEESAETNYRKNDLADLLGYLILLCIECGYLSFEDLLD